MKFCLRNLARVAALCLALPLAGCGGDKGSKTVSVKPGTRPPAEAARAAPRADVPLPVPGTLAIFVDPKVFKARTIQAYGVEEKVFDEHGMIGKAAENSFRRVFQQVGPFVEGKASNATLSLTGDSYYNPIMRTYYVNVRGSMYLGDDADPIGTYKAKAQRDGPPIDPDVFQKAYTDATDDIARQVLATPEFVEATRRGL